MEIDVYSSRAQFQTWTNYSMEFFSPAGCTWIGQISMAFFRFVVVVVVDAIKSKRILLFITMVSN